MKPTYVTQSLCDFPFGLESFVSSYDVIVSDIDYTFIDFDQGHTAGIRELTTYLGVEIVQAMERMFRIVLEGQRRPLGEKWEQRAEYEQLLSSISALQHSFLETHGIRVFSREAWMILASRECHVNITIEQIRTARAVYWEAVGQRAEMYNDARGFLAEVARQNKPLLLMTGSDSVVEVHQDTRESLYLSYDLELALRLKYSRLKHLPFSYHSLTVGDPVDKPTRAFFDAVYKELSGVSYSSKERVLFMGDSQRNDLEIPGTDGYPTLLIRRQEG